MKTSPKPRKTAQPSAETGSDLKNTAVLDRPVNQTKPPRTGMEPV